MADSETCEDHHYYHTPSESRDLKAEAIYSSDELKVSDDGEVINLPIT